MRHLPRFGGWFWLLLLTAGFGQEATHKHGGSNGHGETAAVANRFGTVRFATSCDPALAEDLNGAVALLHSFEYDEARTAFAAVLRRDPSCAMAEWGRSMSYFHGLWGEYNAVEGARAAGDASRLAGSDTRTTSREKAYIAAIAEIYSDSAIKSGFRPDNQPDGNGYSQPSREAELKYTERMAALHSQFPGDREATIFYALALNISAKRSDKSHADLHQCLALLSPLFVEMPNHPGVAHYIIHCSDNPEMASGGLEAARKYAHVAPGSAHATHMPSHIFAQLGLWDEMIQSNQVSLKAAEGDVNASGCEKVGNTLHAMSFLVVALAESGRIRDAEGILERASHEVPKTPGGARCSAGGRSEVLAAYVAETGNWGRAKEIVVEDADNSSMAGVLRLVSGVGAARSGDGVRAREVEAKLAAMRDARSKLPGQTLENPSESLRLAVAGWQAQQAGHSAEAAELLRRGADLQDRLGSNYEIIKPVREMLADLLLLNKDPAGALAEYRAVLALQPNRFDSVYGAGSAAYQAGDTATAKRFYSQLESFAKGDERPELATARARLAESAVVAKE